MFATAIIFALIALAAGLLLGYISQRYKVEGDPVADRIEALLPQTQCGQCDYAGCRPYAEAIANEEAEINRCVPGGEATIQELATLLDREPLPLDEEVGAEKPPVVAEIIEDLCIGCTKCIQACPVDAILGTAKHMHTVIAEECTGCELCLPPCPVDCIVLIPLEQTLENWHWPAPEHRIAS
jgi:electron transport complex protein RnfB